MALERHAEGPKGRASDWIKAHLAGLVAAVVGLLAVTVAGLLYASTEGEIIRVPNLWVTTPFLVVTLAAGITSLVRREGAYSLAAAGVGLAAAAMVLGYALVVGAIALVTALIMVIMHQLM